MLLSLLLTGLLTIQAPAVPTHAEASELARVGNHAAALDAFRRIVAEHPGDHQARLWIARLHVWMGHPDLAEAVYRNVLFERPSSLEAMVGLASTLAARGETREALALLERAEQIAPENPDVLEAMGRVHGKAGHADRAIGYHERALAVTTGGPSQDALEQSRFVHGHRVESRTYFESFGSGVSDTLATDLHVNVRLNDRLRVSGRGQVQRKFGRTDERAGLGVEWRVAPSTRLTAQGLAGPGSDVLPRADGLLSLAHVDGDAEWSLGYRFVDFSGASASILSPGVSWWVSDRATVGVSYHLSRTDVDTLSSVQQGHAASLRGALRVRPRLWLSAAYAYGIEDFDAISLDRLGDFDANTASLGMRADLATLTSLHASYDHQWRPGGLNMRRVTFWLAQRF